MNFPIKIWISSLGVIPGHHHRQIDGRMSLRLLPLTCDPHHLSEILISDLDIITQGRHHRQRGMERGLDLHDVDAPEADPGHLFKSEVGAPVDPPVDQMTDLPPPWRHRPCRSLSFRFLRQWHPRLSLFDPAPGGQDLVLDNQHLDVLVLGLPQLFLIIHPS